MASKTFVFIIDGASYSLLAPWVAEGKLPFLSKIANSGSFSMLKSTIPPLTCPAIPSFYTGKNLGKHGISNFLTLDGNAVNFSMIKDKTVWQMLNEHGLKTCVFYLPITYPVIPLDGVLVSWVPEGIKEFVWPRDLASKYDVPGAEEEHRLTVTPASEEKFIEGMNSRLKRKFDLLSTLEADNDFNTVLFFLNDSDMVQHFAWHRKDLIFFYYQSILQELESFLDSHPFDDLIILSDHGFHSYPQNEFYLNNWLAERGYLRFKYGLAGKFVYGKLYKLGKQYLSSAWISKLKNLVFRFDGTLDKKENAKPSIRGIDMSKTKAYCYYNWGIFMQNEALGVDYDAVRSTLISELKGLKDNSGNNLFKEVYAREELYSGPHTHELPDIILLANPLYDVSPYISTKTIRARSDPKLINGRLFTGAHDYNREGILFTSGKDFKKTTLENANILDLMPTILHLYGIPIPVDLDGKVLDVFKSNFKAKKLLIKSGKVEKNKLDSAILNIKI